MSVQAWTVDRRHGLRRPLVEPGHGFHGGFHGRRVGHFRLGRRGDDARADFFGQNQDIPRAGPFVGQDLLRVDGSGYGKPVFQFVVVDRMAAQKHGPRLVNFFQPPSQDFGHDPEVDFFPGETHQVQHRQRRAAHGVHVAQGICGRDLPESKGVVDNRGDEVDRLHQGEVLRDLVDAGIVRRLGSDQKTGMPLQGQGFKRFFQVLRTQFGRSAGGFDHSGQSNFFLFRH